MKKLICLDTETTGFSAEYDRIIEIGCVDITNGWSERKSFQQYINPKRKVPESAIAVHGIKNEFLEPFLTFDNYADSFLDFIKDATLIIHNANFDIRFLNAELARHNRAKLENEVIDTLVLAKKMFPGKKASLSALQLYFNIQIAREKHGALLDSEILAQIYIAMQTEQTELTHKDESVVVEKIKLKKILFKIDDAELKMHETLLGTLNETRK